MTVTYNQQAWLKERTLIHVSGIAANTRIGFDDQTQGSILTSTVYYTPSADHKLTIDVTDLVRAECKIGDDFEFGIFEDVQGGDTYQDRIEVAGDTNPDNWIIPTHPIKAWAENDVLIGLPRMILRPILSIKTLLPILADEDIDDVYFDDGILATEINGGYSTIQISNIGAFDLIARRLGSLRSVYRQETIDEHDCQKYAVVEWRDRRGMTKRAVWELRNVTENTADALEIENISNAYDVRKGKEITAVLHLDGLTAFDVWYYSDIVTSSDVRVAMKASDYDSVADKIKDECKVEVTTKKAEIPDGDAGEFYSLDIEINYKRYDTV